VEIKYINARVDVLVDNVSGGNNEPVYWAFDEDWNRVGACHSFMGADAMLVYEGRDADFPYPRVYLKINGQIILDAHNGGQQFVHRLVPSSRGMYLPKPKPIKDEDGNVYLSCKIEGPYVGIYDLTNLDAPLYLDCDSFIGERA